MSKIIFQLNLHFQPNINAEQYWWKLTINIASTLTWLWCVCWEFINTRWLSIYIYIDKLNTKSKQMKHFVINLLWREYEIVKKYSQNVIAGLALASLIVKHIKFQYLTSQWPCVPNIATISKYANQKQGDLAALS